MNYIDIFLDSLLDKKKFPGDNGNFTIGTVCSGPIRFTNSGGERLRVAGGGNVPGSRTNVIDFMSFSTGGNAMDYGDLTDIRSNLGAGSNGHGGI